MIPKAVGIAWIASLLTGWAAVMPAAAQEVLPRNPQMEISPKEEWTPVSDFVSGCFIGVIVSPILRVALRGSNPVGVARHIAEWKVAGKVCPVTGAALVGLNSNKASVSGGYVKGLTLDTLQTRLERPVPGEGRATSAE